MLTGLLSHKSDHKDHKDYKNRLGLNKHPNKSLTRTPEAFAIDITHYTEKNL